MTPEPPPQTRFDRDYPYRPAPVREQPRPRVATTVADSLTMLEREVQLRYLARMASLIAGFTTTAVIFLVAGVVLHVTGQETESLVAFGGSMVCVMTLIGVALWPPRVT